MRIGYGCFVTFLCAAFGVNAACGYDVIRVEAGRTVDVSNLVIDESVVIENYGTLTGTLNVGDAFDVYIQNFGNADEFYSNAIQLITCDYNLRPVGGVDNIIVYNADKISLADLARASNGAQTIIIKNSGVILDGDQSELQNVTLQEDVVLYIEDISDLPDGAIMSNVTGNGTVRLNVANVNPLYRFGSRIEAGNLYIDFVRDTDYSKILGDKLGGFLDELRIKNSDDKLLAALDGAASVDEIHSIMSRSARIAPMQLMDIVRVMNVNEMSRVRVRGDFMSLIPMAMFADNASAMGGAIDRNYGVGSKITLGISGYAYAMSYGDGFDEYESALYGGNVHIAYFDDVIFARALAGVSVANFYTGAVFNGTDIVENPMGFSGYGAADFGVAFDVARNVNLMPFVRGGVDYANIANLSDTEFIAAIGANLLIDSVGYDLKYQYGVGVNADIRGIFNADAQMYISSPHDNFSAVLSVGAIYDESTGFGFKLGLNLGAKF